MSSDARLYPITDGRSWVANHDGPCNQDVNHGDECTLGEKLAEVEHCMGANLRWEFHADSAGRMWLRGWCA